MKRIDSTNAINTLRAKADIAEVLNNRIEAMRTYEMVNGEIENDWQIENNNRCQSEIDVLQSLIAFLVG